MLMFNCFPDVYDDAIKFKDDLNSSRTSMKRSVYGDYNKIHHSVFTRNRVDLSSQKNVFKKKMDTTKNSS